MAPVHRTAPTIETERLRLRAHRLEDYPTLLATWSDPAVYRHIGGQPATPQDAWARLLRYGGLWSLLGYGYWAIEERHSGTFVGDIGYADFRRDITPSLDGMPELGWVLASTAHGRGYATEALAAVSEWGRKRFGAHRSTCIIDPGNAPSIRVADKAGFRRWCETTYHGEPILIFVRDIAAADAP